MQAILIGSSVFQKFSKLVLNAVKLMMNQQAKIDCRDSISEQALLLETLVKCVCNKDIRSAKQLHSSALN